MKKNFLLNRLTTICILFFMVNHLNAQLGDYSVNLGLDETINVGNVTELNGVSQFTMEIQVKLNVLNSFTPLLNKQLSSTDRIQLQLNNGRVVCIVGNGTNSYRSSATDLLKSDEWYHITMVFDGTLANNNDRLKLYINGFVESLTGGGGSILPETSPNNSVDLILGHAKFDGTIDEFRIWDTALEANTIALWSNKEIDNTHTNYSNLRLYWQFNNNISGSLGTVYSGTSTTALTYIENSESNPDPDPDPEISEHAVLGYLPSYRVNSVDESLLNYVSHVIYKSIKPLEDGSLHPNLNGNPSSALVSTTMNALKAKVGTKPVKIIAGMGGGTASGNGEHLPTISASDELRKAFAIHLKDYCFDNGIDGIDINWEFPDTSTERANWVLMLKEIYETLNPAGLLVTASFRARNGSFSNIPLEETVYLAIDSQPYLDLASVQIYNRYDSNGYHVPYSTYVGLSNDYANASGIDKTKLLLGAPFYAKSVNNNHQSVMLYSDIINQTGNAANVDAISGPDDDLVYNSVGTSSHPVGNYAFNGVSTMIEKAVYVKNKGLKGMMVWEMGQDVDASSNHSLLKAINGVLPLSTENIAPTPGFIANTKVDKTGATINFTDKSSHGPTSWSWSFVGGTPETSSDRNPQVIYNTNGTYPVTLTVSNISGTKSITRTAFITINESGSLSVTDHEKNEVNVQVYPNPFSEKLNVTFNIKESSIAKMTLFDITGRRVWEKSDFKLPGVHELSIDSNLSGNGIYILHLNDGVNTYQKKILKL